MFCTKPLGSNEVVETFPVGRRLAFDAAKGRLWVVCRKCERWNLSPLEERWEGVEQCERIFRDTRVRVSTENVGLARHPEGLELVRIGKPLRPEFAAWRYGDQFGRRRRRHVVMATGVVVVSSAYALGATGLFGGMFLLGGGNLLWGSSLFSSLWQRRQNTAKLRLDGGRRVKLRPLDLFATRIRPDEDGAGFKLAIRKRRTTTWHEGDEARRLAAAIVPKMNHEGGKAATVQNAVAEIESSGHPSRFIADVSAGDRFFGRTLFRKKRAPGYIAQMPQSTRLALEMALHEEQERQALEGELWRLEQAWREAEEIAEISDNLLLPEGTEEFLERHGKHDRRRMCRLQDEPHHTQNGD